MTNAIGTNQIGASFAAEIAAAGFGGLPFSWGEDGQFSFGAAITDEQRAGILAVYAAHDPVRSALIAYANAKQWALATGGYTVTLDETPRTFATDTTSQALISGKALRLSQPSPPASLDWQFAAGFVTLSADDFMTAAVKIADFVQATFDTLRGVIDGINLGTITTVEGVDAAAWPAAHD